MSTQTAMIQCRCATGDCIHKSDCAVHNEPAEKAGSCDCLTPAEKRALPNAHYSDGRRYSRISKAWIFAEDWNDREEVAYLQERLSAAQGEITQLRADFDRAMEALESLSFECDGVTKTEAPRIEVHNRTFNVLHELRMKHNAGKCYGGPGGKLRALSPPSQQEIQR